MMTSIASPAPQRRFRLSPLSARRWQQFCAHRRGVWSLILVALVLVVSLAAEFIANDKPLLVQFKGNYYLPVFVDYPETHWGGDFPTTTNYRDPFVRELITNNGWAIWPLIEYSYNTINYDLAVPAPAPPSAENWLGTDDQGRDVLARLIYGLRLSLLFGLTLTILATFIGVFIGGLQGYFGGWVDLAGQRLVEIWSGLPVLFLLIILSSLVQPNFFWLLLLLLAFSWMSLVGVVRAEFLRTRALDYVKAARALGVPDLTIAFRHILPNAMVATLTFLPFQLTGAITTLTALDFLGFGMPPGTPSLGELLAQGKNNIEAPWLGLTAFFTLAILLSLLVFVGEAVRDAFDPRKIGAGQPLPQSKQGEVAA